LLTGFREQEVMFLRWSDVNFELRTVRVTSKPELGFYPKRWEDREIPAELPTCVPIPYREPGTAHARPLQLHRHARQTRSDKIRSENVSFHLCHRNAAKGVDVRTVQHWMGHKSLETTMRYLAPATDVHDEVDLVKIPSVGKADPAPRKSAARESRSSRKARSVQSRAAR
jgi:integrase